MIFQNKWFRVKYRIVSCELILTNLSFCFMLSNDIVSSFNLAFINFKNLKCRVACTWCCSTAHKNQIALFSLRWLFVKPLFTVNHPFLSGSFNGSARVGGSRHPA